jgi:hypothetical protein
MAGNSNYVKGKLLMGERYPGAQAPKKVGPYIPKALGQGFYGPFDNVHIQVRISKLMCAYLPEKSTENTTSASSTSQFGKHEEKMATTS